MTEIAVGAVASQRLLSAGLGQAVARGIQGAGQMRVHLQATAHGAQFRGRERREAQLAAQGY